MRITIDDREDNKRQEALKKAFPHICFIERIEVGDIIIEQDDKPTIAIEVKTIPDFISSLKNKRLDKELISMHEKYSYSYCIVYGDWSKDYYKYNKATVAQKYSAIVRSTLKKGVPVFYGATTKHLIVLIDQLIKNISYEYEPLDMPIVRDKSNNPFVNVLIGIDGIGAKTAQKLLDKFHTPGGVFMASEEELNSIPRLSKKSIKEILRMKAFEGGK